MLPRNLKGMNVAVIGAWGSVGQAITRELYSKGVRVAAVTRDATQRTNLAMTHVGPGFAVYRWDVTDQTGAERILRQIEFATPLDAIIYTVGHCPAGGLQGQTSTPLSNMDHETLQDEFDRLVFGIVNTAQVFLPIMAENSRFVVVGSAITRFDPSILPPEFYVGHYAAAQASQAELLRWLEFDSAFVAKKIAVTRIAFGAMDTPFHSEGGGPKPPRLVPLPEVVENITTALLAPNPMKAMVVI